MIILASSSPRRRELLASAGYDFTVKVSEAQEITSASDPKELVVRNAKAKAFAVFDAEKPKEGVVLGADTVVVIDGSILGKPADDGEAFAMLKTLSGRAHAVMTGYCVIPPDGKAVCGAEETKVFFRELTDGEIARYVATGEPRDKAGAYGIQEKGALLVERVEGDFFNVVGLPLAAVGKTLSGFGILPEN